MAENFALNTSIKMTKNDISFGMLSRKTGIPKQTLIKYATHSKAISEHDEAKIQNALNEMEKGHDYKPVPTLQSSHS